MRLPARVSTILATAAGAAFLAYAARRLSPSAVSAVLSSSSLSSSSLSSPPSSLSSSSSSSFSSAASSAASPSHAATNATMPRGAVLALSHGGGPLPVLGDPESAALAKSLRTRVPAILGLDDPARRPSAIVVVTAHWSETRPTLSSAARHDLLYDYYGFPAESYRLRYPAPGAPDLARRAAELLRAEGLDPVLDAKRGWDHGVFVPLLLVRPQADIPVLQMSVLRSEDPAQHFAMGRALRRLRDEAGVAIVGSGFASLHNLRLMFSGLTREPSMRGRLDAWNAAVTAAAATADPDARDAAFRKWRTWPSNDLAHPVGGAEHFLPLVVCAGAGADEPAKHYSDDYLGVDIRSFYWE